MKTTNDNEMQVYSKGKAIIVENEYIVNIMDSLEAADEFGSPDTQPTSEAQHVDLCGKAIIPGLIDNHTHLLWAGDRSQEIRWKIEGKTYQDIAHLGGGIQSTVASTRESTEEQLLQQGYVRLRKALRHGTTHLEMKSGYGLDVENELKLLNVGNRLSGFDSLPTLEQTWLGAHDIPSGESEKNYVDELISTQLPSVIEQGYAVSADVFCEPGWFSIESSERVLTAARDSGLRLKMHIDEFEDGGGGELAADLRVITADHAYHTPFETRIRMRDAGVMTGFLPGTPFVLGESLPNPHTLKEHSIPFTLASDFNPHSQSLSLPMAASLMVRQHKLHPYDALKAVTVDAATVAPSTHNLTGMIANGGVANFNILESQHWESWCLTHGHSPFSSTVIRGKHIVH